MKIVYCINNTWYSGGMTRVLANKVNYLAKQGHEVIIVTTDQIGYNSHYTISPSVKQIDLGINYLGDDPNSFLKRAFGYLKKLVHHKKKMANLLNELEPDIVISMFGKETYFINTIHDGSKKIVETHLSRYTWLLLRQKRGLVGSLQNRLDEFFLRKFDKLVLLTEEDRLFWKNFTNLVVIPNANTFSPDGTSSLENKQVIAVGRYDYQKNFEDLIRAWKIVHSSHPDWILEIVGDGSTKDSLTKLIEDNKLGNSVVLTPTTPNILEKYLNSSILVLSSRYEGFGMVLIEAQACGLPLVSYDCKCGPKDIITHGENGFLVKEGDIESLAKHISILIENKDLRKEMGVNGRINSERFSEKKVMDMWLELFSGLISNTDNE